MKRRDFIVTMTAGVSSMLSGCITSELMNNSSHYEESKTYTESVSSFFITSDGKKFIAIGNDYHYLFNASESLIRTLKSSFRSLLSVNLSRFTVKENTVNGWYELTLDPSAGNEYKTNALEIGFVPKDDKSLVLRGGLRGFRYSAERFNKTAIKHNFNNAYQIEVSESLKVSDGPGAKILLTPITIAADGALIIVGAPALIGVIIGICVGPHKQNCPLK